MDVIVGKIVFKGGPSRSAALYMAFYRCGSELMPNSQSITLELLL